MLKRFIQYYKPHRKLFFVDMSTAFMRSVFAVCIPWMVRNIMKTYLPQGCTGETIMAIVALILLSAALAAATFINIKWGHVLGTRMETDMRSDLFRHLQKLSFKYFDNTKTGHIMSRISNDLFNVAEIAHHAPEDFFISFCTMTGAFIIMFTFNTPLAIVAIVPMPFIILWGLLFQTKLRRGFRQVRKRIADINSSVENSIQGIREVKSFGNEDHEINKFTEVNTEFRFAKENMYGIMAAFHSGMMFLFQFYPLVIVTGGAFLINSGRTSPEDLVAFLLYVPFIMNPIHRMVNFVEQFQQGAASFERFIEVIDEEPDVVDRKHARTLDHVKGDIDIQELFFKYVDGEDEGWVLENINMSIPAGRTVALVGRSGAGKSTLASLIPRFYEPQKGRILMDGCDIMDLQQSFLREKIGIVQQNVFLFDSTIRDNIAFGKPGASEEELIEAAKKANIYNFIIDLPEGLDTIVGEHGVKLSGGQKQRVSIARVFLKNPAILIFDEATSSLDTESETLIRQSMEELCKSRTTIIIAHRLTTVKNSDYTYVIDKGRIIEQGTHKELLETKSFYFNLYSNSSI